MGRRKKGRDKKASFIRRFFGHPVGKLSVAVLVVGCTLGAIALTYYYLHFARLTDEKLAAGPIGHTAMLFSGQDRVMIGDQATVDEIVAALRQSGYTDSRKNRIGWYNVRQDAVEIFPGRDSNFPGEDAVVFIEKGHVSQIISLRDNTERTIYRLEPQLVTNLFNHNREKRLLVRYSDLPPYLIDAVVSAEDKRFFQHAGFDPIRILKTAWVNLLAGRIRQGASTLTMQLAGDIWLDRSAADLDTQIRRGDDHPASGTEADQATDLRVLRQPDLPWPRRKLRDPRLRPGRPGVLQQGRPPVDAAGGGAAGRTAPRSRPL